MIKPTVGRVVWFQPGHIAEVPDKEQPFAALIAYVWSDRMINVAAFDSNGKPVAATSVALLQDDDPVPQNGHYAQWMPYQVGQAKAVEPKTA